MYIQSQSMIKENIRFCPYGEEVKGVCVTCDYCHFLVYCISKMCARNYAGVVGDSNTPHLINNNFICKRRIYIMIKYRAFIKANIYPQDKAYNFNLNDTFSIYIPEHITYDTKQKVVDSKTRWDYSFGLNNKDVVILIRHITVVDDTYGEIRSMPEFCYDYDTFVKLGGWMEYVTRDENVVNIDRVYKNFNCLYPNLLNDNKKQIHIEPIDMKVYECQETKNIRIPTPVNHIIQNSYVPVGNNNCNRPLVDESFFKALFAFEADDIKGKNCHITEDYISVNDFNNGNSKSIFYDVRMQSVVDEDEWTKHCYEYTVGQKRKRKMALEKQGLLDAYNALEMYLQSHNSIRKIDCDTSKDYPAPYEIIERDLAYGYKLNGFVILEDAVVWEITTYERPIKQNDCIRGMDTCYLMFKDGIIVEAAKQIEYKLMCDRNNILEDDYEAYNNEYIDISSTPLVYSK